MDCENIDGQCGASWCNCDERRKQKRFAEGWWNGEYFCIEVAARETIDQLAKHIESCRGAGNIQVRRFYWCVVPTNEKVSA